MTRTRDRQRAEQRNAHCKVVALALRATVPQLDDAQIAAALEQARAASGISLRQLADHFAAHPGALSSGDPNCPAVLVRLAHVLHGAGHEQVVRPGCSGCGKVIDLPRIGPAGRVCQMCTVRASLSNCARCGRSDTRIAARRAEGGICFSCYRTDPEVVEECGQCRRLRMPVTRLDDGTPLCARCWTPPQHRCDLCGNVGPADVNNTAEVVCQDCYRRHRQPARPCGRCGRTRPIAKRATDIEPDLCDACNLGPHMLCSVCGRTRPSRRHGADRAWYCHSCAPRASAECSRCGKERSIHARWPIGPLCATCHNRLLDSPATCRGCGQFRVLVARSDDGAELCGPCAGIGLDPRCASCDRPGRHYSPGRCAHCTLEVVLRDLLSGSDGEVPAQLEPVYRTLTGAGNPRGLIRWSAKSPNARLLAQLAASGEPLTHELLDRLPPGRHEFYVRQLLVTTGVLPERHDDLERLPSWLDTILAPAPAEHARLVRPFTHWFLLRRARRRAAVRRQPALAGSYLRTRITTVLALLSWLDEQNLALRQLDQPILDSWLAAGNASSYTIRYFLAWAHSRDLASKLVVPVQPRQDPERILDEQQRWDLLRGCLTDDTMTVDLRAVAALVLLFGLPVSRIRHLTVDQLEIGADRSFLRTGEHPLPLPPKLAALLQQLAETPRIPSRFATNPHSARWLFPGQTPGRPRSQSSIQVKLRTLGIAARPARNAALMALAGDLPVPVLADVLGLSITTAEKWSAVAKRDWAAYVAERATTSRATGEEEELGTSE
ncbi:MAG: hypothetical protein JOZ49_08035 [Mycolicibacterium sp.]|nr:hypothetical protein [Mycolicibacterium sp.]